MNDYQAFGDAERAGWTDETTAANYVAKFTQAADRVGEGMIEALSPPAGIKLLDVCCGHGVLTGALSARGCDVTGIDFSPAMLEHARRNAPDAQLEEGDAQDLPFADATFDMVVCNMGIMHIPDQLKVLSEARRVLKPGGRFAMTAWVGPKASKSFAIAFGSLMAHTDPTKGAPPQPDFFQFADPDAAKELLSTAGFSEIKSSTLDSAWDFSDPDELFQIYSKGTVRMAMILDAQPEEVIAAVRETMREKVEADCKVEGGYHVPIPAALVTATA